MADTRMSRAVSGPGRRRWLALLLLVAAATACGGGGGGGGGGDGGGGDGGGDGGATAPSAITGLAARATGPTSVSLTWTAPEGALEGFEVERASAPEGPFALAAKPPATATGYGDNGLTSGATYHYRVRARNAAGSSPWSPTVSATLAAVDPTAPTAPAAPSAPSGLVVTPASTTSLELSWTDNASDETGFEIERAEGSSTFFVAVGTAAANAAGFTDTGLATSATYSYRVRAVNDAGPSTYSAAASATTALPAPPAAPTGFAAGVETVVSTVHVRLTWTDAATNEAGYELQRSTDDGASWPTSVTLPANATAYLDPALIGTLTYRLRAVNLGGASAWATATISTAPVIISVSCMLPETAPTATALSATSIHIAWTWTAPACPYAAIERAPATSGPWVEIARPYRYLAPSFPTSFDDTGLSPGTTYHYRLRFVSNVPDWGGTGYTAPLQATTTPAPPPVPSGLTATVTSAETATLAWAAATADGFAVEYATAAGGPYTEAFRLPAGSVKANLGGMTPATAYWFRVRALKGGQLSDPSNVVTFVTATRALLRAIADTTVMESTAVSANQNKNITNGPNSVGCYYVWTVDLSGSTYYFHNCAGSALRFDTSSLAGRNVLAAGLRMFACGLAPHPVDDAKYVVRALTGAWNPATVTFNTLPARSGTGWMLPAPTSTAAQGWDVTPIVRSWASGSLGSNGLYVGQEPIIDVRSFAWSGVTHDNQDQTTSFCSLEQTGGSLDFVPTLSVDYIP